MYALSQLLEKRIPTSPEKLEFLERNLPEYDGYTLQDRFYIEKLKISPPVCKICGSVIHVNGSSFPKTCGEEECLKKANIGKLGLGIQCPVSVNELKYLIETITVNGVAKKYNVSRPIVDRWCKENNINQKEIRSDLHDAIIKSINHLTPREIANKYNIRVSKIRSILKTHSIEFNTLFDKYKEERLKSREILRDNIHLFSELNLQEIAEELDISYEHTKQFRVEFDLPITINRKPFSKEEKTLLSKIQHLDENVGARKYTVDGKRFEVDIFFPATKIGVEYNGSYFHDTFRNGDPSYHLKKLDACQQIGIRLLHFWDYEVKEKFEIVESIIEIRVKGPRVKIFARKCEVIQITEIEAQRFFDKNHLAGFIKAKTYYGLVYKGEIVQALSISKTRFKRHEDSHEIIRSCSSIHTQIVGGLSRLVAFAIKNEDIKKLVTFADKRFSNGNSYKAIGFKEVYHTPPNYVYQSKNGVNYSRHKFMKHKLIKMGFDAMKTEHTIMRELGYKQLHDCGSIKFEMMCV